MNALDMLTKVQKDNEDAPWIFLLDTIYNDPRDRISNTSNYRISSSLKQMTIKDIKERYSVEIEGTQLVGRGMWQNGGLFTMGVTLDTHQWRHRVRWMPTKTTP